MTVPDKPEFSIVRNLSDIIAGKEEHATADAEQRAALAKRFDLPAIESLEASYVLDQQSGKILLGGTLTADVVQSCAVSGQDVPVTLKEPFNIAFVHSDDIKASDDEVELSEDDCDVMEYSEQQIDLGEAFAQTLFLALDPYPRADNADEFARQKGLQSEEEAGPFGALAGLKDKLG